MNARPIAAVPATLALAATLTLAACGGGGGSSSPAGTAPQAPATTAPVAPQSVASVPMSLTFPRRSPSALSARAPQFVSPGTESLALYDGSTLVYVANVELDSGNQFSTVYAKSAPTSVTPGSCTFNNTTVTCTLTITTTIGAHTFGLVAYPLDQGQSPQPESVRRRSDTGSVPTFTGVISSEGQVAVNLSPGTNPGATLTMLGVASQVVFAGLSEGAYNGTVTYGYRIDDSTNSQIVTPGDYDNGPITITASPAGIVTISPSSFTTPPASTGDQNFDVTCVNAAGGDVTISFNARTSPNTAYASGLTYSAANYAAAVIATTTFTCDPAAATIPITVHGKHR